MSRAGYSNDLEQWALIRWRGAVVAAFKGKRGQAFLREMLAALDAMPQKRLVASELEKDGDVCALGCVGRQRGLVQTEIDPEDYEHVAKAFGIAEAMAREIEYHNDEGEWNETPEQRWTRMRAWVAGQLV